MFRTSFYRTVQATETHLVCACGSRNAQEPTKLVFFDFSRAAATESTAHSDSQTARALDSDRSDRSSDLDASLSLPLPPALSAHLLHPPELRSDDRPPIGADSTNFSIEQFVLDSSTQDSDS